MTDRILDVSDSPASLRVKYYQLVIDSDQGPLASIPLDDLAVLIVAHAQVRFTHAVLSGLATAGGVFVTCNEKRLPVGMLVPLDAHYCQVTHFAEQAAASLPTKKRLWRQIVRAKIAAQARTVAALRGNDAGLPSLISHVRSGDPTNVEARAARRYWPALFGGDHFRRDRDAVDQNQLLNYGYGVLRAIVARAICAAGLHPSLGLHHHHRGSTYPLADDLMEPLRPVVDRAVALCVDRFGVPSGINRGVRRDLLSALLGRFPLNHHQRTLFDIAARTAQSLAAVYSNEARMLELPEV